MSLLNDMDNMIKKQAGKRYRFVRLDPANVTDRLYKGYELVLKGDPEVKDTPLDKHAAADGQIRAGGLALARISESRAREHEAAKKARLDLRMKAIKAGYKKSGEDIKRKLGSAHKGFNVIVQEEED